ncbi:unnamed protein product [Amoebophrya sp. A25]|nr:unnamed protein product [Amoebophrya sp. A25]|eukprot:GSA25T00019352001.1
MKDVTRTRTRCAVLGLFFNFLVCSCISLFLHFLTSLHLFVHSATGTDASAIISPQKHGSTTTRHLLIKVGGEGDIVSQTTQLPDEEEPRSAQQLISRFDTRESLRVIVDPFFRPVQSTANGATASRDGNSSEIFHRVDSRTAIFSGLLRQRNWPARLVFLQHAFSQCSGLVLPSGGACHAYGSFQEREPQERAPEQLLESSRAWAFADLEKRRQERLLGLQSADPELNRTSVVAFPLPRHVTSSLPFCSPEEYAQFVRKWYDVCETLGKQLIKQENKILSRHPSLRFLGLQRNSNYYRTHFRCQDPRNIDSVRMIRDVSDANKPGQNYSLARSAPLLSMNIDEFLQDEVPKLLLRDDVFEPAVDDDGSSPTRKRTSTSIIFLTLETDIQGLDVDLVHSLGDTGFLAAKGWQAKMQAGHGSGQTEETSVFRIDRIVLECQFGGGISELEEFMKTLNSSSTSEVTTSRHDRGSYWLYSNSFVVHEDNQSATSSEGATKYREGILTSMKRKSEPSVLPNSCSEVTQYLRKHGFCLEQSNDFSPTGLSCINLETNLVFERCA